jgi:hypothetical protein
MSQNQKNRLRQFSEYWYWGRLKSSNFTPTGGAFGAAKVEENAARKKNNGFIFPHFKLF